MIRCDNIGFSYNSHFVLRDLSFRIDDGEFVGIIGPNGAGKSTLLKLIDRILSPQKGRIFIQQKPQRAYSQKELARIIGFVQQDFSTTFNYTVKEMVLMGRFPHQRALAIDSAEDVQIALDAMTATDCLYLRDRDFSTLSGGERQRVILASALAQEPLILLLDEPTTALDLKHQTHFYQILKDLQKRRKMTIVIVTHDINLAAQYCDRIVILKNGQKVAEGLVREVINQEILQQVYEVPIHILAHPERDIPLILAGKSNSH